jgi:hypothetical protein
MTGVNVTVDKIITAGVKVTGCVTTKDVDRYTVEMPLLCTVTEVVRADTALLVTRNVALVVMLPVL